MTYATEILSAPVSIADRMAARIAVWKEQMEQRAQYRATVRELNDLSDRELNDLGLGRSSIRFVARMAVYGN
ncbi:DUF1127 domain-containing protein [Aliiroseovarius sp. F47248L]|uniref:DUF1127 domain-containing protein n=1 Tax=Aliiroseovarius sp. F47248L TaxID=2926420 RepID=UPI001FF2C02F|nr:DUF1127 domain-containing protein [Aliiroseovarius sp. F47248L]MCK0138344.1 DUF1127 domain-containing protein [Aliiroseovarius sp. F47248L]